MMSINVHRPTQLEASISPRWSSWTKMTWEQCSQYLVITKGSIKLDTFLVRPFKDIQKILIRLRTYEENKALIMEPDEEVSFVDPWYVIFVLLCVLLLCWIMVFDVFEIVIFNVCCWNWIFCVTTRTL